MAGIARCPFTRAPAEHMQFPKFKEGENKKTVTERRKSGMVLWNVVGKSK